MARVDARVEDGHAHALPLRVEVGPGPRGADPLEPVRDGGLVGGRGDARLRALDGLRRLERLDGEVRHDAHGAGERGEGVEHLVRRLRRDEHPARDPERVEHAHVSGLLQRRQRGVGVADRRAGLGLQRARGACGVALVRAPHPGVVERDDDLDGRVRRRRGRRGRAGVLPRRSRIGPRVRGLAQLVGDLRRRPGRDRTGRRGDGGSDEPDEEQSRKERVPEGVRAGTCDCHSEESVRIGRGAHTDGGAQKDYGSLA